MDRSAQHLLPSSIIGPDGGFMIREPPDQVFGPIRQAPPGILLFIPVERTDIGQEPPALFLIWKDIPVQVFRIPVNQYAPKVKNNGIDHTISFFGLLIPFVVLSPPT